MALSFIIFFWNAWTSGRKGELAGDNPWNAWTLEWLTSSPPPPHNFELIPPIGGRRPLWDRAYPDRVDGGPGRVVGQSVTPKLDSNRLLVSLFLLSEAVFFLFLIVAYVFFRGFSTEGGPTASDSLDPLKTGFLSCLLFASSGTLGLAERGHRLGQLGKFRLWMGLTILLGALFLGGQANEYSHLLGGGLTVSRNLFGTTFFTLTGLHGLHLLLGLVMLSIFAGLGRRASPSALAAGGLYWHFVDAVWAVLFVILYLGVYL
jgi:heme/copper-type cytochrome/quinol oxidase subunit 3